MNQPWPAHEAANDATLPLDDRCRQDAATAWPSDRSEAFAEDLADAPQPVARRPPPTTASWPARLAAALADGLRTAFGVRA